MSTPYLKQDSALPYCKGCSHSIVLRALGDALEKLQIPPAELAIVTDIGCVGLADAQFATPHTVHTTHGRSTAFAGGLSLADSVLGEGKLKPIVLIGDGGAMIGLNHLVNAALLNLDVTVLVHNNFLFGMTGGQNSAFTPLDFVTSTTQAGNTTPPLELALCLLAARAPFVARQLATDGNLAEVLAKAISHPGFALVEILELCTAYATRWNSLTGAKLKQVADRCGFQLGILRDERRPRFKDAYREMTAKLRPTVARRVRANFQLGNLPRPIGVILAGTAGERVQTAAGVLAEAAMRSGLHVTLKNDNPVTQGSGFSLSEVILSETEILFTGVEQPDVIIVVSGDGLKELERNCILDQTKHDTLILADEGLTFPDVSCHILQLPLRKIAGANLAALAGVAWWLEVSQIFPLQALRVALEARFGAEAASVKTRLSQLSHAESAAGHGH
ncbi:MAG: thiamine pyrophosphate-dependent enzyme [Acidobacteria bacterium]|nr:thiamine pyrophosphate-dependent enzyme [Acidobacteriota bacterium]